MQHALFPFAVGYFQPEAAQFGCLSCDSLGDFYQELPGQTSCLACPKATQRYVGGFSGVNKSACQCKAGVQLSLGPLVLRSSGTQTPVQGTTSRRYRPRSTRPPRKGMPGRCTANFALVGCASIATQTRSLFRAFIRGIVRARLVLPLRVSLHYIAAGLFGVPARWIL